MTIVATMVKLVCAILLGLYLGFKGTLSTDVTKKMSSIIVKFTGPALVISSIGSIGGSDPKAVLQVVFFGALLYFIALPVLSFIFAKILRVDKDLVGTYMLTIIFCNNTFMGFPVVQALLGDEAIFYTSVMHMGFNVLFYTVGLALIKRDVDSDTGEKFNPKTLINPGTIAAIIVLILFFGRINPPEVVIAPFSFVGQLTMPMSMMIIGANMSQYKLKEIFGDRRMYILAVVRLILVPMFVYYVMGLFIKDTFSLQVATLTFGMPVASMVAMGTAPYDKQGKVGAVAVAFTTVCSLITIPLWAFILHV